jgi:sarcosine oxidase subunit gamma
MITLRGDLSSAALQKAACDLTGCDFPGKLGITGTSESGLCWMSPDELLILCTYAQAHAATAQLTEALKGTHHLVANVSDARAMLSLTGGAPREVLAKLSPADMSATALAPGTLRRSRLAQVPAAVWIDDTGSAYVICFRSVAQYVFDILKSAALPGSEVGFFDLA